MPTASANYHADQPDLEEWRPVVGYEGLYEVSSLGRVRSLDRVIEQNSRWGQQSRRKAGRVLRLHTDKLGYRSIKLCKSAVQKTSKVAHLVAAAFIGPRPTGQHVCHNDGVPGHDAASNLRYDTIAGNFSDKLLHGTLKRGSDCSYARATEDQVRQIRADGKTGTWDQLAERYGLSVSIVRGIVERKTWRHI